MARVATRSQRATAADAWSLAGRLVTSWAFLLPTLIFFLGWQLYPVIRVLWLSFTDYHYLRTDAPVHWVWFQNYADAFRDPLVWRGLLRAALFTALFLPGMIFIPMVVAVLVDRVRNPKLATIYRVILLIPSMIPGPLIFVLWKWLYSYNIGPINYLLVDVLGLFTLRNAPRWLGDPTLVFPSLAVMEWWWGLGYHTMFFLAGLATIPRELYDAARVDGANEWRIFWHITFPRLQPILLVLVVLRFGTAMAVIDEYLIMGGFNRALPTYTWTVYMWDLGFQLGDWNQSYAAAVGWIGALAMLIVVAGLFWLFRSRD
ncbi:MAG: sugar ABC transporter permease [Sphaerobacter sp.]|nr:sugar ABC transporter permease [Sphaerobacter sp.]